MKNILKDVYNFIELLNVNNNREWFNENKHLYLEAKAKFDVLVDFIGKEIEKFDSTYTFTNAKSCTYRIYRDVRFSKNKLPYKNHFGAFWNKGGRKSPYAGYYLHIQPGGESFFGGGIYRPEATSLKALRSEIYYSYNQLDSVLNKSKFKNIYPELLEDKLMRGPKDFPKDCDAIEYLKYKSLVVGHDISDNILQNKDISAEIIEGFVTLQPLIEYINGAIDMKEN
ncbi:MAG: DUF2461 domain-containing protein [Bacteroidetes bacterium]|nr:MAG: DUF2461 domain-containing protein [Bacteroidota bacterium]